MNACRDTGMSWAHMVCCQTRGTVRRPGREMAFVISKQHQDIDGVVCFNDPPVFD